MEQCFKLFDKDGSGSISSNELKQILAGSSKGEDLEESLKKVINEVDKNGDGEVNCSYCRFNSTNSRKCSICLVKVKRFRRSLNYETKSRNYFLSSGC